MKKKFTFLFTALFAVTSLWAQEFQSGDLMCNLDEDGNVMVVKGEYNGLTKVVIPETVKYEAQNQFFCERTAMLLLLSFFISRLPSRFPVAFCRESLVG